MRTPAPTPADGDGESLQPPPLRIAPGPAYAASTRLWQGIPAIEHTPGGRLWAAWYSGGTTEGPDNHVLAITSDDGGQSWSEPRMAIDPPGAVRAYDPALWHDPMGRLWLFWAQSKHWFDGRAGVWAMRCDHADAAAPRWTAPRRLCNGVMMNKPTVLGTGEWLLPAAVWARDPRRADMEGERFSNVFCSTDHGTTWTRRGGADVPDRAFDEHMVVERRDGTLWMLVRTTYGIGESVSADGGVTWTPGRDSGIAGPNSRFFIRRLRSGALLLVNHVHFSGRSHLTALISDDDGARWTGGLLLDERKNVSYPDGIEAADGRIFVIYDRERSGAREILMATFREADVRAGASVSADTRLRALVNRAGPGAAASCHTALA